MEASVKMLAIGAPHCNVCPIFLGQPVPVVHTDRGYALFCEVCDLGRHEMSVRAPRGKGLKMTIEDLGDAAIDASEEE